MPFAYVGKKILGKAEVVEPSPASDKPWYSQAWSGIKPLAYLMCLPAWPFFGRPSYFYNMWGFKQVDQFLDKNFSNWSIPRPHEQNNPNCPCPQCTEAREHLKTCKDPECSHPWCTQIREQKKAFEHAETCEDPDC